MKGKSFLHSTKLIYEPKISEMVSVHGAEGYGIFMVLLEMLCNNKNKMPAQYFAIAQSLNVSEGKVHSIINNFDLFSLSNGYFSYNFFIKNK